MSWSLYTLFLELGRGLHPLEQLAGPEVVLISRYPDVEVDRRQELQLEGGQFLLADA